MAFSKMLWFRIVVDSLHDLSAGIAPGAVIALSMVRGGAKAAFDPLAFANLARGWTSILLVLLVALVVLVVTGGMRLSYRTLGVEESALPARGRAALIKHALFVTIFIVSTVYAFSYLQG